MREGKVASELVILPIALLAILLLSALSSVPIQGASQTPVGQDPGKSLETGVNVGESDLAYSSFDRWDWQSYADSAGYVDVVLVVRQTVTSESPSDSLIDALSESSSAGDLPALTDELDRGVTREYYRAINGLAAHLPLDAVRELSYQSGLVAVYPDFKMSAMGGENIRQVEADQVWTLSDSYGVSVRGSGIVVAVIDTGVDYTHPDLGGGFGPAYKVIGGYDFSNNDADPRDDHGHGTHVAGIIAASGGSSGVAPEAKILAYKVLGRDGSGSTSNVIAGIEAAMDPNSDGNTIDHADIISMSLGGPGEIGDPMCLAVERAVDAGIVVVVAAGNSGPTFGTVASPGLEPKVITVGAIDSIGNIASFSSRGTSSDTLIKPEISAPGVNVVSTVPFSGTMLSSSTGYMALSGTSMATPHVSGVAALLVQLHPDWTPEQVKSAMISGSKTMDEPLWHAGAGALWAPSAAATDVFASEPIVSYGSANNSNHEVQILNQGPSSTFAIASIDWHSMWYNGSSSGPYWTNSSTVTPASVTVSAGGTASFQISVTIPSPSSPEGYFEGAIHVKDSVRDVRIPFGFMVLSKLSIHVLNRLGNEISDPRGEVLVYSYPDAVVAIAKHSTPSEPSTPATFFLPSGSYSAHALGHQLFYSFNDPYVLSGSVVLGRSTSVNLYLRMAEAKEFTIDLATADGNPIYVKDFLIYCKYNGVRNVSSLVVASDSLVVGNDLFTLAKSKKLYLSDTDATIGVFAGGFSYSADMWDFMSRNWNHWYEVVGSNSTEFLVESTADLQYLISWEFVGINDSTATALGVEPSKSSVFQTKYDILGPIGDAWQGGGVRLAMGGDATPYVRRSAFTSLNPFFSGMTRENTVQGVYTEYYWPGGLTSVYIEPEYYIPDFGHRVKASDVPGVYLADRNYLNPMEGLRESVRIGAGPFYPSVRTMNNATTFGIIHPLLSDQGGGRVATPETPRLYLYRNGAPMGNYNLDEHLGNPTPERVIPLTSSGNFKAIITMTLASKISSTALITLGFSTISADMNPPSLTGLSMSQRFIPGSIVPVRLSAVDDSSVESAQILWRPSGSVSWNDLAVSNLGGGVFEAEIQTSQSNSGIDLKFNVSDPTGNYLEYVTKNASLKQVSVQFDVSLSSQEVGYIDGDASVVVTGRLTDLAGSPLHPTAAIPIEFMLGGRKVAMVLDEYTVQGSHNHNGTIRFDWHFNPARLFTGPNQIIEINVSFDLGIYQPIVKKLYLHSNKVGDEKPVIRLVSPANNSLIPAGQALDFSIWDDGDFTADAYLDGTLLAHMSPPWDIDTANWQDGRHTIQIVVTDEANMKYSLSFEFDVDALKPVVNIIYPKNGFHVPVNSLLRFEVSDSRLSSVWYSIDGLPDVAATEPYDIDMAGWETGTHRIAIWAADEVDHVTSEEVSFDIAKGSVAIALLSPDNDSVIRSGTPIVLSITGNGNVESKWMEYGVWHVLGTNLSISTGGWVEGSHEILVNATSDVGDYDEYCFVLVVDDTAPTITLESPSDNSFVDIADEIRLSVDDANLETVVCSFWNETVSVENGNVVISLQSPPSDGYFHVQVMSTDKAGNEANATYTFAMDSSPPVVSFEDWSSGDAIRPGYQLNFTATDTFLSMVQCAIDSGALAEMSSPFAVNTNSLSGGIHQLTVVASDLSGKKTTANISFYVDAVAPNALITSSPRMTLNATCTVTASVSDDYGLAAVQLFYELRASGYGSVVMAGYDGVYVAELAPDLLWKGMTIYVLATDRVGNVAESPRMTLQPATSRFDGNLPSPGSPSGWGAAMWAWIVSTNGLAVLGLIGVITLAGVVLYARRRREDESTARTVKPKPSPMGVSNASPFAELPPPKPIMAASAKQIVDSVKAAAKAVGQVPVPTQVHTATASGIGATARVRLLDSIPEITLKPDVKSPEDDIDYGELIERELNTSAWKNSAFGKGIGHSAVSRELDARPDRPGIISGLKLKKIME